MTKTKIIVEDTEDNLETEEPFDLVPPETHYLSTRYVVKIPVTDRHLQDRWELRKHAAHMVERALGDEVQVTSLKVRKPHLLRKSYARMRGQVPCARAYVTIKF